MIVIEDANYHCSFDVVMKGKLLVRKLLSHFPKDLNKGKFIINN